MANNLILHYQPFLKTQRILYNVGEKEYEEYIDIPNARPDTIANSLINVISSENIDNVFLIGNSKIMEKTSERILSFDNNIKIKYTL